MPRAEFGSTKYIGNKLKSKGLQRLRWYCQVCERQMRDENGFKCHTQSEGHVRQMLLISGNPNKAINNYSTEFEKAFIQQLRTSHGTKPVHINHFYQEYIANKEHIHMNATKWHSLTDFAKYLSKEGICRVEETEKGLHIAWIDNSPEALRRQNAIQKQERMEKGDEEREQKMLQDQIDRAHQGMVQRVDEDPDAHKLERAEGEKITFSLGLKPQLTKPPTPPKNSEGTSSAEEVIFDPDLESAPQTATPPPETSDQNSQGKMNGFKMSTAGNSTKPKNIFAAARKNPFKEAAKKSKDSEDRPKKMSEAERIMKEELERKRSRETGNADNAKRQKIR